MSCNSHCSAILRRPRAIGNVLGEHGARLCRYTDILQLGASGVSACKLLCNRSRAYAGALRYNEALQAMSDQTPNVVSARFQSMMSWSIPQA